MHVTVQIEAVHNLKDLSLVFYNDENKSILELLIPLKPISASGSQNIALRPGHYTLRGIATNTDEKRFVVESAIQVPDHNAKIEITLRQPKILH